MPNGTALFHRQAHCVMITPLLQGKEKMQKEAKARIKINTLLQEAGWRFFDDENGRANIVLENNVKITQKAIDAFGEDYEKTKNGYIDFLLLDEKGFPIVVLEAKSEEKSPLDGKEQARRYAKAQNVRFIILSNGNLHYFWDLERGNPTIISSLPTVESLKTFHTFKPNPAKLADETVREDYIVLTQYPTYQSDPRWMDETQRGSFIKEHKLKFLRPYQLRAMYALQASAKLNNDRYLFEMATGTGKTLISAAVIKLFLKPSGQRDRLSRSGPALFEGSKQGLALVTKARELLALSDGGLLSQFAPADAVKPSGTLLQVLVVGRILLPPGRISHTAPVAQ